VCDHSRLPSADYVIIGAGSAGCVLATRLTEDANTSVILIEAGGKDTNPLIHVPAGFFKMLDHNTLTWKFRAEPDPGTGGRAAGRLGRDRQDSGAEPVCQGSADRRPLVHSAPRRCRPGEGRSRARGAACRPMNAE